MRQNEALEKILGGGESWMEFIFSSLNGISVPEKNIGYKFLIASFVFTETHIQYFFFVLYHKSNEQKAKLYCVS